MIYPYKEKFVTMDSIRECLTGYGRFIYYQTYGKDSKNEPDPTLLSQSKNWLMEVKEGAFRFGKAEGY